MPTPLPELRGRPPVPSAPNSEPAGETSSLTADHGAEPSFDESPPGAQVCCTANFWASDADTPPEDLQYSVSVENLQDVSQSPAVQSSSEVRDGRRWVAVSLDFPHGTLCEKPSIDVTVTFRNKVGQSASTTMTIDRN